MADQGLEGLLSPYLRRKRLKIAPPYLKARVLDFGCRSGALAALVYADQYLGMEVGNVSLQQANSRFSKHCFVPELPRTPDKFDTTVSLAVVEHASDPAHFLQMLAAYLDDTPASRLVVTTPHPCVGRIRALGASNGFFSRHANGEREDLLDRSELGMAGSQAGLKLVSYHRFLFGANQIEIYAK